MNTIKFDYVYEGKKYFQNSFEEFKKKISKSKDDFNTFSMDLKDVIVNETKDYYEYTGDATDLCNLYFDIDVKFTNKKEYNSIMKNDKYIIVENKIKSFLLEKLNEMKIENSKELKLVDCRNHRITYDNGYKFSYRLFCYTHKLEKYKIKNIVLYLNKIAQENKDLINILPFNSNKIFDEVIYNTHRKMRCVNSSKPNEEEPLKMCNDKDKSYKTLIQLHKFKNCELYRTNIINIDEKITVYNNVNKQFDNVGNGNKYMFNITIEEVADILNQLNSEWYETDYYKWLNVMTVIKNLYNTGFYDNEKLYKEWDKFNQQGSNYNGDNNYKLFMANEGKILNINYLVCMINKIKKTSIPFFKKYVPMNDPLKLLDNYETQTIEIQNNIKTYMNITINDFINNDTLIFQGTTGTGKTTLMAKTMIKYKELYPDVKFLSIVDLIKLAEQQIITFDKEDLKLSNYKNIENSYQFKKEQMIVCCINSLHSKFNDIEPDDYIVYIDEINSFIENYLTNDLLNPHLQKTNRILMSIISKCKKLIVSDAHINNLTMQFLNKRKTKNGLYILNPYKKYENIEAMKYNKEQDFINEINRKIKNNEYFLFGCDSKTIIERLYNNCVDIFKDKKEHFILITKDHKIDIEDASKDFKNKFVFYSPSIKTGIDFTIDEEQEALLYINGKTISSEGLFQQLTRTRNLKGVKYYSNCESNLLIYDSLKETEEYFDNLIVYSNNLNESETNLRNLVCYNDDEETKICKNTFYKLYLQYIYNRNIQDTNKLIHFENILKVEGFNLYQKGNNQKLSQPMKDILKSKTDKINNEMFDKFCDLSIKLNTLNKNEHTLEIINIKSELQDPLYDNLHNKIEHLCLLCNQYKKYQIILMNDFVYEKLFKIRNLFLTDKIINGKIKDVYDTNENVKIINNKFSKIIALRKFEKDNNITPFDVNFHNNDKTDVKLNVKDDFFDDIKFKFRMDKKIEKPKNLSDLNKIYIQLIKNMTGDDLFFIKNKQKQINKKRTRHYWVDYNKTKWLFDCLFNNQKYSVNLDINLLQKINVEIPDYEKD